MKDFKTYLIENENVNESFLSVGLTIIVSLILAKTAIKGVANLAAIFNAIKTGIQTGREYTAAVKELDNLLQPYKDQLMETEWGKRLFNGSGIVDNDSVKNKGCAIIYMDLDRDIKSVLSPDDYKKYKKIIEPIYDVEHSRLRSAFD